jgi:hypothetical protein
LVSQIVLKSLQGGTDGSPLRVDVLAAAGAALLALAIAAAGGFASLADSNGDNDSLLRMVEVRDLIAGQGWFDLMQYRMGLDGGFLMHWSRLVDAPIAAIVMALTALTGSQATGELVASVLWPSLLLGVGVFLLLRVARFAHGPEAQFPALVVGALSLMSIGIFQPGAMDHHNLQLVLILGMALGLLAGGAVAPLAAGACAALTMAVGMETLPYVAVGGFVAAMLFLVRGEAESRTAFGFGLGFASVAAACFVATVPWSAWAAPVCDAMSVAQGSTAVLAGLGLATIATAPALRRSAARRAAALAILGLGLGLLVLAAFPQCLADPYATLDPRLRLYWLDGVTEAQSIFKAASYDPAMLATWYATPILGLAVMVLAMLRQGVRRADAVMGGFLAAAILISFWQVRGAVFAVPLAVVPLSGWIARRREIAGRTPSTQATVAMALAWVLSFNAVWSAAAGRLFPPAERIGTVAAAGAGSGRCYGAGDFAALAALPARTVLAVSNVGAGILKHTPHRALAGPYHRNVAGNLAVLDIFLAEPAGAEALARKANVGIVAMCPGNPETRLLAGAAPDGLIAVLAKGEVPAWLEPVEGKAGPFQLYRVEPE